MHSHRLEEARSAGREPTAGDDAATRADPSPGSGFGIRRILASREARAGAVILAFVVAAASFTFTYTSKLERHPPVGPFLSSLEPTEAHQGWGLLARDNSVSGGLLAIRGRRYPRGLGTHAVSRICYAVDRRYRTLVSDIGVDDAVQGHGGQLVFRVEADGRNLFESGPIDGSTPPVTVRLDISGVARLCLLVDDGGDGINSDHADWAGARLEY